MTVMICVELWWKVLTPNDKAIQAECCVQVNGQTDKVELTEVMKLLGEDLSDIVTKSYSIIMMSHAGRWNISTDGFNNKQYTESMATKGGEIALETRHSTGSLLYKHGFKCTYIMLHLHECM